MVKVIVGKQKTQNDKPFPKIMKEIDGDSLIFVLKKPDCNGMTKAVYLNCFKDDPLATDFFLYGAVKYTDYNEPITLQNA